MSGTVRPLRVCIVALNAYPAIDPRAVGPIGGIETRAWSFARGLARRDNWKVSMFVRHGRRPRRDEFEGVTLIPLVDRLYHVRQSVSMCIGRRRRFPWLTLHRWRAALLWQLPLVAADRLIHGVPGDPWHVDSRLSTLDTDVFCTFGVQSHSATVIASAHAAHRPAVLFLGSDGDLDENYGPDSSYVSPYGDRGDVCWRILQEADAVIVQTEDQQRLLHERFGRESTIVENPIDVREWDAGLREPLGDVAVRFNRYVLWVGRAEDIHKRPDLCLEVAHRCPEINFLMVLNPRDPVVEHRVRRNAPANVQIISYVPCPEMPAIFARAAALLNTSALEGFPNVFLQAAVSRIPIASLNVGREFLTWLGCGRHTDGDMPQLAAFLQDAWNGAESATAGLETARIRVIQRYDLKDRVARFAEVLRVAASAGSSETEIPNPDQNCSLT